MVKCKHIRNQSGIALVIALVMLLALTVIGISSLMMSTLDTQMSGNERRAAEALNLADAGIERGLMDLLTDYAEDRGGDADWSNNSFTRLSLTTVDATVTNTLNNTFGDFSSDIDTQWGDPFNGALLNGSTDNAVPLYGDDAIELGTGSGNWYKVLILRDPSEEDEVYMRSYALHSTGARKILQLHLRVETIDAWTNAVFAGRGSATATINGNVNVAGSIHLLGTGATNNWGISGDAAIVNGYKDMGKAGGIADATSMWNRLSHTLEVVGEYNGEPVYSLESVMRVKNVQVTLQGSASIGDAPNIDSDGDGINDTMEYSIGTGGDTKYFKSTLDAVRANKDISGDVNADVQDMPDGYDLGDKIQMPSFEDPYNPHLQKDRNGLSCSDRGLDCYKYEDYITQISETVDGATNPTHCTLNPNTAGSFEVGDMTCTDPNDTATCTCNDADGCFRWVSDGSGTGNVFIEGRVKFTGCPAEELKIAPTGGDVVYRGKGLMYTPDSDVRINGNLVNPSTNQYLEDDVLGLLTKRNVNMAEQTPNTTIMAAVFAAGSIGTSKTGQIYGALVANLFCMGPGVDLAAGDGSCASGAGQTSDIFYTPGISDEITKLGAPKGNTVYSFKKYEWEEKW